MPGDFTFTLVPEAVRLINEVLPAIKQQRVTAAQLDAIEQNQNDVEAIISSEFHDVVKVVLSEWDFKSISKQTPGGLVLAETRTAGFRFAYQLPDDFLRINEILIAGSYYSPKHIAHEIENNLLLSNHSGLALRYGSYPLVTGLADDATVSSTWNNYIKSWNPSLRLAVVTFMKYKWFDSIKRDERGALNMYSLYNEEILVKAKINDSAGESVETQDSGPLVHARSAIGGLYHGIHIT